MPEAGCRQVIISVLRGGIGNQLFQFAAGFYLAERFGQSLYVDGCHLARASQKREYALGDFELQVRTVGRGYHLLERLASRANRFTKSRGVFRVGRVCAYLSESEADSSPDLEGLRPAMMNIIEGYWQQARYAEAVLATLRDSPAIRNPGNPLARTLIEELRESVGVAVHVRRGDYVTDPPTYAHYSQLGDSYYQKALRIIMKEDHVDRVYVFSDDIGWVRDNMHFETPVAYVNSNLELSDVDEFSVMSNCRHFVIANSTFSWWAALLGASPNKIVVAPGRWLRDERAITDGLIPAGWRLIEE